jgi:hypothetical protein
MPLDQDTFGYALSLLYCKGLREAILVYNDGTVRSQRSSHNQGQNERGMLKFSDPADSEKAKCEATIEEMRREVNCYTDPKMGRVPPPHIAFKRLQRV